MQYHHLTSHQGKGNLRSSSPQAQEDASTSGKQQAVWTSPAAFKAQPNDGNVCRGLPVVPVWLSLADKIGQHLFVQAEAKQAWSIVQLSWRTDSNLANVSCLFRSPFMFEAVRHTWFQYSIVNWTIQKLIKAVRWRRLRRIGKLAFGQKQLLILDQREEEEEEEEGVPHPWREWYFICPMACRDG